MKKLPKGVELLSGEQSLRPSPLLCLISLDPISLGTEDVVKHWWGNLLRAQCVTKATIHPCQRFGEREESGGLCGILRE